MKVIFLDMDGVMNSTRSVIALRGYGFMPPSHTLNGAADARAIRKQCNLDPISVGLLKRILKETGAKVVISSSWRFRNEQKTIDVFNVMFKAHRLPRVVIGSTPHHNSGFRGEEIRLWLEDHPEVTAYIILDDDSDMHAEQQAHFLQTNNHVGLGYEQYDEITKRWNPKQN